MKRTALPLALALAVLTTHGALGLAPESSVLFSGSWTKGGYVIEGGWSIVVEDGERFVVFDEGFKTRRAPDLKIFLSPLPLGEIGNRNATRDAVLVAPLERPNGAQRYAIDADVDLDGFQSLIIHCERFSKYWGGATLTSPETVDTRSTATSAREAL